MTPTLALLATLLLAPAPPIVVQGWTAADVGALLTATAPPPIPVVELSDVTISGTLGFYCENDRATMDAKGAVIRLTNYVSICCREDVLDRIAPRPENYK